MSAIRGKIVGLFFVSWTLALPQDSASDYLVRRGGLLFEGSVALPARMKGHEEDLPPRAVRCANCHTLEFAITTRETFGPALGPQRLRRAIARRGGPPTRFTKETFCQVVRSGIDPAHVTLGSMPRYQLDERQCQALWSYLTQDLPS